MTIYTYYLKWLARRDNKFRITSEVFYPIVRLTVSKCLHPSQVSSSEVLESHI